MVVTASPLPNLICEDWTLVLLSVYYTPPKKYIIGFCARYVSLDKLIIYANNIERDYFYVAIGKKK